MLVLWVGLMGTSFLWAQQKPFAEVGEEGDLFAETKQVNQFFRRFNCEETLLGERLYPGDSLFRDPQLREGYLRALFDKQNPYLTDELKASFIQQITQRGRESYLDFHGGNWFAEVHAKFSFKGNSEPLILFMKLQEQPVGSKWVIDGVYMERFYRMFVPDTVNRDSLFLHPLSHELDFMNLGKIFRNSDKVEPFTSRDHQADQLTLFMYEVQNGNLTYETVTELRFHFLQVNNWYFEIANFNRSGFNRGWLISKLIPIPEGQKDILLRYIYNNYQ
jgi:hypothetical protein